MPAAHDSHRTIRHGTLYLVATPIGNLSDITHRALEILRTADTILAEDTRRTRILLDRYGIAAGGLRSFHRHNEAARTAEARELLSGDGAIALVSDSGTPLISDPGLRLVRAALEVGASVVPIPGPCAALSALVASGLDPQPFTFFGFVPRASKDRRELMARLAALRHTAILFESPQRLLRTLEDLSRELGSDRRVVVARELTKLHEEFVRGTLSEATAYYEEHAPRGEVVICLAGAPEESAAESPPAAGALARSMVREGASSKEIVKTLRDRFGVERNRAYAIALEAAEEEDPRC